jgi:hypothetical protein
MQDINMKLHPEFRSIQHEERSFNQQIGFKIKDETDIMLHLQHIMYCAEIWTLREVDHKYVESLDMVLGRSCEK